MGEIRSALEIALEKTAHIEGDPLSADKREMKNRGKRAAGEYLETGDASVFTASVKGLKEEDAALVREGALSNLLAGLKLPADEQEIDKTVRIGEGLEALFTGAGIAQMFAQVGQILAQYLGEQAQLKKALEQQFMPRLRAKQEEMARRYGQTIPLELHQDPEYVAAFSKNKRALEERYSVLIDEIRSRVKEMAGISENE